MALDWFRRERAWINEQHLKLCRVPAPTFLEQKRAEWMAERFRELGWEARLDRSGNVVAALPGRRDSATVAVTAHLDTVLAPRSPEEIKLSGDGRLLGPGVSDNGAGLAALLALAAAWNAAPPLPDAPLAPLLIANVGEEGEGNLSGMRYLCRDSNGSRPKAFLVLDGPNTDHITCRALASRRFEVTVTGPGGHSWSDYGAGNPVHALSRAISEFTAAAPNDPTPRSSFNFGLIQGGTSINCIPTEARAKVDLRSEKAERIDEMASLLAASVAQAAETENSRATGGRVTARLKEIGSRPGGELREGAPILELPSGSGCVSGHSQPPGLLLDRRQHPAVAGNSRGVDRRGRPGRRRAHARGMVSSGKPRAGPAPDSAGAVPAAVGGMKPNSRQRSVTPARVHPAAARIMETWTAQYG